LDTEPYEHRVDVGLLSFKAGATALVNLLRYYPQPSEAVARLQLRADIVADQMRDPHERIVRLPEVARLINTTPTHIPIDHEDCTPPDKVADSQTVATEDNDWLIANFKKCSATELRMIAAEMAFRYAEHLRQTGTEDANFLAVVQFFEIKQLAILKESMTTGSLRRGDQDDHSFGHYLDTLAESAAPIWIARQTN
jgi:hypothetical protein